MDSTDSESSRVFTVGCEADESFNAVPGVGECENIGNGAERACGPFGECKDRLKNYECECRGLDKETGEKISGNIGNCEPSQCGDAGRGNLFD